MPDDNNDEIDELASIKNTLHYDLEVLSKNNKHSAINKDRWLVSYADFMTLLCAFFITLYSIDQLQIEEINRVKQALERVFTPYEEQQALPYDELVDKQERDIKQEEIYYQLEGSLIPYIENQQIEFRDEEKNYLIRLKTSNLFTSPTVNVSKGGVSVLNDIALVLKTYPNLISVHGRCSDKQITDDRFSNHWQLSSYLATSVVASLAQSGVAPQRMKATSSAYYQNSDSTDSQLISESDLAISDESIIDIVIFKDLNDEYWQK